MITIPPKAARGENCCYALSPDIEGIDGKEGPANYYCLAAEDHKGQHVAYSEGWDNPKILFTWADDPHQVADLYPPQEGDLVDRLWARYQKAREWRRYTTTPGDLRPDHIFKRGKEAAYLEMIGDLAEEGPGDEACD